MVGVWSNQLVRLLRLTSTHHQPSRIAMAIAFGILVGLVPKATGLGILLCLSLLLLPIHNLAAIVACLVVTPWASLCDPLTHQMGTALLRSPMLVRLWSAYENASFLPWLGLQNTVTLGSAILGLLQLGPTYVLGLRLSQRMSWHEDSTQLLNAPRIVIHEPSHAIAAPHFKPTPRIVDAPPKPEPEAVPVPGLHVAFVGESKINRWHVGDAQQRARLTHLVSTSDTSKVDSMSSAEIASDGYRQLPRQRDWSEPRSASQVLNDATDILDWIDESLEDCLALDCSTVVSHVMADEAPLSSSSVIEPIASTSLPSEETLAAEESWLMETTIEIVRWADSVDLKTSPEAVPLQATTQSASHDLESSPKDFETLMQSRMSAFQADSSHTIPCHHAPNCTEDSKSVELMHTSIALANEGKQTISMVTLTQNERVNKPVAMEKNEARDSQPLPFPPRSEALSYLIQHLRESRDGSTQQ